MTTEATASGKWYEFTTGDRLRVAREETGMTQREFAEATGISAGSVYNYENDLTKPRRLQLAAWALATGFDKHWLETGNPPTGPSGPGVGRDTHRESRTDVLLGLAA